MSHLVFLTSSPDALDRLLIQSIRDVSRDSCLDLAVVLDLFSRRVVGWATADHLRADLACAALRMALGRRRPRGSCSITATGALQYASDTSLDLLREHGIEPSRSRKGNCGENAVTASVFSTTKRELTHHESYATRGGLEVVVRVHRGVRQPPAPPCDVRRSQSR